jgi:2-polyprenyl-6-methoxyphenol hydroxylase-like FAD-dependent oxidoreductase
MRVAIIGGGIGGLAAAVALRRVGIASIVFEQVSELREIGAGLSIWSNAMNAIRELGLETTVLGSASLIEQNVTRALSGSLLTRTKLSPFIREAGAPCICIHRASLQRILLDSLPRDSVVTGARCSAFHRSTAIFETGERIEADALIGADGIYSVIRDGLHGAQAPRYAGYTCWRGIRQDNGMLPAKTALLVMGGGSQFGVWPCGPGQLYWFLTRNAPPGTRQYKSEVLAFCRDWAAPAPEIIEGTPANAILQSDVIDRPPLSWWGRGPVTLLGDAAHASTPNLGQGACQALEDAIGLAHCLSQASPIESALRNYEALRIPRTSRIVRDSWRAGKALQLESPALASFRDRFVSSRVGNRLQTRALRSILTYRLPNLRSPD